MAQLILATHFTDVTAEHKTGEEEEDMDNEDEKEKVCVCRKCPHEQVHTGTYANAGTSL